jgi:transposase-like protein
MDDIDAYNLSVAREMLRSERSFEDTCCITPNCQSIRIINIGTNAKIPVYRCLDCNLTFTQLN